MVSPWKRVPFVRLLVPYCTGLIVQWYYPLPVNLYYALIFSGITILVAVFFLPLFARYKFSFFNGIGVSLVFISIGGLLIRHNDIRNDKLWIGNYTNKNALIVATLIEPPVKKTRSLKATATINLLAYNGKSILAKGKVIIYFSKNDSSQLLYGSQIIFFKPLQTIKNSGNPGCFDYQRYSLFDGITHQVFLKENDYQVASSTQHDPLQTFLYSFRERILHIISKTIPGAKESGLAEALLIGYKNDLDPLLVQSYANTGVVHIIAISGLHLGLIYWLLVFFFQPFQKKRKLKWVRLICIVSILWLFSLLSGAQPSVLRSAVMFTCIILAEGLSRKSSIYNTLSLSAFLLLCYNPFWLWDIGFQLSYAAVLSIIIFMQPIYNWFYIPWKLPDVIWKLCAVTIAAQILTLPLCIYHFHQFPSYFLLTNIIAVPLSSLILLLEIIICAFPVSFMGEIVSCLIAFMNGYIERIDSLPCSLWGNLQINNAQAISLFCSISLLAYWLMERSKQSLKTGLFALAAVIGLRSYSFIKADRQKKIIVYNVPRHHAIDVISGRKYYSQTDTIGSYLQSSHTLYRTEPARALPGLIISNDYWDYYGRRIFLIDSTVTYHQRGNITIDLLIISRNPRLYLASLARTVTIKQIVFSASVPAYKLFYWKRDCDSLRIPWHDVSEKGAFVMTLN